MSVGGRRAVDGHGGAPNTLVDDFKHLLDDPSLSDITFVFPNEGDKKIRAHKNIISARCAPMQALLRSGTRALLLLFEACPLHVAAPSPNARPQQECERRLVVWW